MTDDIDLEGRLEKATILGGNGNGLVSASVRDRRITLSGASHLAHGDTCLVRIAYSHLATTGSPDAYFVSSRAPEDFKGFAPGEYILVARWEPWMTKSLTYPTLDDVDQYYNPGRVSRYAYFESDHVKNWGRLCIDVNNTYTARGSVRNALNYALSKTDLGARLLVVEPGMDAQRSQQLMRGLSTMGVKFVVMQPRNGQTG